MRELVTDETPPTAQVCVSWCSEFNTINRQRNDHIINQVLFFLFFFGVVNFISAKTYSRTPFFFSPSPPPPPFLYFIFNIHIRTQDTKQQCNHWGNKKGTLGLTIVDLVLTVSAALHDCHGNYVCLFPFPRTVSLINSGTKKSFFRFFSIVRSDTRSIPKTSCIFFPFLFFFLLDLPDETVTRQTGISWCSEL